MEVTRPTVMEVDINAFKSNIEEIKKYIGNPDVNIMPVIKANGYGTWINRNLEVIKDFKFVVTKFSLKYYWLIYNANSFISSDAPLHLNIIRSNNKFLRRRLVYLKIK